MTVSDKSVILKYVLSNNQGKLFKNHKAMTLIYRRNQGDNFLVYFSL